MSATAQQRLAATGVGYVAAGVIVAWVVFAILGDLQPNGRHLLVLGALRVVLFGLLLAVAVRIGATRGLLGRTGLVLAGVGAAVNFLGGAGAVITDGWSYNPFEPGSDAPPPWYAYLVLAGGLLFALGPVLVGIAARSASLLAGVVVAAGVLYAGAILGPLGHLVWIAPWLVLACLMAMDRIPESGRISTARRS